MGECTDNVQDDSASALASSSSSEPANQNTLSETFPHADSGNPTWLEIEPDVTTSETVRQVLETHNIDYELTGGEFIYDIYVSDSNLPFGDGMGPSGTTGGAILIDDRAKKLVVGIILRIDICVSTVVETFGTPIVIVNEVVPEGRLPVFHLLYPNLGLLFRVGESPNRVSEISLHSIAFMQQQASSIDYHDWDEYADLFAGECTDNVQMNKPQSMLTP